MRSRGKRNSIQLELLGNFPLPINVDHGDIQVQFFINDIVIFERRDNTLTVR